MSGAVTEGALQVGELELAGAMGVLGPDDVLVLRSQQKLTPELVARISDQIAHVMQGSPGRVLVIDSNFDVLIQRGGANGGD